MNGLKSRTTILIVSTVAQIYANLLQVTNTI